ncbi:MAG: chitobiase/beta-hexosaminidase C-terminal domain-containing protein [Saprospiraceae bacterium]|nr:chitobiase/beta-hexosaminidase C-terminal domain-containing protein [Saprospiraceae bacterium]
MNKTYISTVEVKPTNGLHKCVNLQDLKGHLQVSPQLRALAFVLSLSACGQMTAQQTLQLAPPQTASTRLFAKRGQSLAFDFRLAGAEIRYTTDGGEPMATSPVYKKPLKVKQGKVIKAKSFKSGYEPSVSTTVQLLPPGKAGIDSMAIAPAPKKYMANGWKTLCDGKLGDGNFQENWLGFEEKTVEMVLFFAEQRTINQLAFGYLQQQGSWIFGPAEVQVYGENGRLLCSKTLLTAAEEQAPAQSFVFVELPPGKHKSLTIKIKGLPAIPDWHPGKGSTGWIFLDEVVVY